MNNLPSFEARLAALELIIKSMETDHLDRSIRSELHSSPHSNRSEIRKALEAILEQRKESESPDFGYSPKLNKLKKQKSKKEPKIKKLGGY